MLYALGDRSPQLIGERHFVADDARVIGAVTLHEDTSVWFGCVLRGDCDEIVVGEGSNVQDGAILHTDPGVKLLIGRGCTVGHQAMLHGCHIGDHSLVGIQSVVLNGAKIGKHTLIGAGTLVPEGKNFPEGVVLMGRPAKIVRELTAVEVQHLKAMAHYYVENARRFREQLRPLS
jgi:carbonic anhydrase/acetyltransferase-like protein (isoleucine patch superfamily)